jgi:hypothetical protein
MIVIRAIKAKERINRCCSRRAEQSGILLCHGHPLQGRMGFIQWALWYYYDVAVLRSAGELIQ